MARKRRSHARALPADIARRRLEARAADPGEPPAIDPSRLRLSANADVALEHDLGGRVIRARRQDVFDLMSQRGKLTGNAVSAVQRLQEDVAMLHRTVSTGGDVAERVDRSRRPESFGDARLAAGARIERALTRTGAASARLLLALIEPEIVSGRSLAWREIVARETGETLPDAQGAVLRLACENLAEAYGAGRRSADAFDAGVAA